MKRSLIIVLLALMVASCAEMNRRMQQQRKDEYLKKEYTKFRVDLTKHPDYSFAQTDETGIKIYDKGLIPLNSNYVVIGKIFVAELPEANQPLVEETIRKAAAFIGGEGVLFIDEKSEEQGGGTQTKAMMIPFGKMMFYRENSTEKAKTIIVRKAANVIRWQK
jgi:hypothetical protein